MSRKRSTEPELAVWDGVRVWHVPRGPMVYFVGTDTAISPLVKIGRTLYLQDRLDQLQGGCPIPLHMLAVTWNHGGTEELLHGVFADLRAHGEWFDLGADPLGIIAERVGDLDAYAALAAADLPPLRVLTSSITN